MAGLQLTPRQNQEYRLLLRVCRRSLVAIPDYGNPIVSDTLPLYQHTPSLMNALLGLAAQIRSSQATGHPTASLDPYHSTLREFQQDLSHPDTDTMAAVAGALVLVILSIAGPGDDWQHHAAHATHLIDCADLNSIKASRTGLFLVMLAAHADMAAFTLGRSTVPSSGAWSRWRLNSISASSNDAFLPHEIVTGYPASLMSLISELDTCAGLFCSSSHVLGAPAPDNVHFPEWARLQHKVDAWKSESLPGDMPKQHRVSLRVARKSMHYAAILYHARMYGFRANLLRPLPNAMATINMVESIILSIQQLLQDYKVDAIPTANAMAWPLTVAGCECGNPSARYLQGDILTLINDLSESFSMSHLKYLVPVFQSLWTRYERYEIECQVGHVSLEDIAREHNVTILLL